MEESSLVRFLKSLIFGKESIEESEESPQREEWLQIFERLESLSVRDFLIPRLYLKALDIDYTWEETKEYIVRYPHHYYPVYRTSLDNYLGYVSLRDLLPGFLQSLYNWKDFIQPALTLPEGLPIVSALEKFRQQNLKIAFVVDEHSEFVGIVRFKDIVEDLFLGTQKCYPADQEGWITLPAITKLRVLEKCYQIEFPRGDYETLAGFILENLKRIPQKGEKFTLPPIEVEILEADERKIDKVRIKFLS